MTIEKKKEVFIPQCWELGFCLVLCYGGLSSEKPFGCVVLLVWYGESFIVCVSLREELVKQCLEKGTKLVQAVADALFNLPSTDDPEGPIVTLPQPTTRLPREKPVCTSLFLSCLCNIKKFCPCTIFMPPY